MFHGGWVQEVFADYSLRYLFDDDVTFNSFNEPLTFDLAKHPLALQRLEIRGGQYVLRISMSRSSHRGI
jgi:hypothetical protein